MSVAADYAFPLAYQWWLYVDFGYLQTINGKAFKLDGPLVREIAESYDVGRTIGGATKADADLAAGALAGMIRTSGAGDGMTLIERAARSAHALERKGTDLSRSPISAITKISWFVWPDGWTMFDSLTSKAVLGRSSSQVSHMERFYAALQVRGWLDVLRRVRERIRAPFDRRMAERVLDKYLFLSGLESARRKRTVASIDGFVAALPADLRDSVQEQCEAISDCMGGDCLLHRDTDTDMRTLNAKVAELRSFKEGLGR